jgi:hypothetical protein
VGELQRVKAAKGTKIEYVHVTSNDAKLYTETQKDIRLYLADPNGCGDVNIEYAMEELAKAVHIFVAYIRVKPLGHNLTRAAIAFLLCGQTGKTINNEISLICAKPIKVGAGIVLMNMALRYFTLELETPQDVSLHALHPDLLAYYGRHGFVPNHKDRGCGYIWKRLGGDDYFEQFYDRIREAPKGIADDNDKLIEQVYFRKTNLRSKDCYQSRIATGWNPSMGTDVKFAPLGYYMVFCHKRENALDRSNGWAQEVADKQIPEGYSFTFETDKAPF